MNNIMEFKVTSIIDFQNERMNTAALDILKAYEIISSHDDSLNGNPLGTLINLSISRQYCYYSDIDKFHKDNCINRINIPKILDMLGFTVSKRETMIFLNPKYSFDETLAIVKIINEEVENG